MKNLLVVLVMGMFFAVLAAGLTFAAEPCPTGQSCSENFSTPVPQTSAEIKAVKQVQASPEEIAASVAIFEKATKRDGDHLIKRFIFESKVEACLWASLESDVFNWLIRNEDFVIDRKEYAAPSYKVIRVSKLDGKASSQCATMIVVHYHKKGGEQK